ncbi:MAG: UDP-glucose 4-epimerase [Hyphomicrobiales bacterium]|nr:MAG: UDP-glucose 4-epimerase [Hyphomicrobiales bacterium]
MPKYLITGGTGSFGNHITSELLKEENNTVVILSRDEKKQEEMRFKFSNENLKFKIGDIRDFRTCLEATEGMDHVFNAAALKQVPSVELNPFEAVKTNIMGAQNVLDAATKSDVQSLVMLSTDKAVYPINAMGVSKSMMEKLAIAKARDNISNGKNTKISVTRYGNVMSSRGSVIPLFLKKIENSEKITVTNMEMTRFMMSLQESVDLVKYAFQHANGGEIFIQKTDSTTLKNLIMALELHTERRLEVDIIGIRHGEKMHETLASAEEMAFADDCGTYWRISADLRSLIYSSQNKRTPLVHGSQSIDSGTSKILSPKELLNKMRFAGILA